MPRPPRIKGDDIHYHIILRCNNKERLLQSDEDFIILKQMLFDTKQKFQFRLYNYDFLHSHVHMMLSTHNGVSIDQIMHDLCSKYARDFNRRHKRSGHLWGHRYRSRIIEDDRHGLACLRYQHRNAMSAGIVSKPENWPWSGFHFYALDRQDELLEFHPSYEALSDDSDQRKRFYSKLVYTPIPSDKIPGLLEKGNGELTRRFVAMVGQVEKQKWQITKVIL